MKIRTILFIVMFGLTLNTITAQEQCFVRPFTVLGSSVELKHTVSRRALAFDITLPKEVVRASFMRFNLKTTSGSAAGQVTGTGQLRIRGIIPKNVNHLTVTVTDLAVSQVYGLVSRYNRSELPSDRIDDDDLLNVLFKFGKRVSCKDKGMFHALDNNNNGEIDEDDLTFVLENFGSEISAGWWYGGDIVIHIVRGG